jgi:hypothetical protein
MWVTRPRPRLDRAAHPRRRSDSMTTSGRGGGGADLPQQARERLAQMRQRRFFTSDLSVNEFLLVKDSASNRSVARRYRPSSMPLCVHATTRRGSERFFWGPFEPISTDSYGSQPLSRDPTKANPRPGDRCAIGVAPVILAIFEPWFKSRWGHFSQTSTQTSAPRLIRRNSPRNPSVRTATVPNSDDRRQGNNELAAPGRRLHRARYVPGVPRSTLENQPGRRLVQLS